MVNRMKIRPFPISESKKKSRHKEKPVISAAVLAVIILGCLLCDFFIPKDPTYMDLYNSNAAPSVKFWFGSDTMGRDLFSMLWYGGRISLFIGFFSTMISTALGILIGAVSGLSPKWLDSIIMRFTEIFLSIPSLLLVILIQAILGKANVISISVVIGPTSWTSISKVVRTEVKQFRSCEYVIAAVCMGAGFFHILRKHLIPNLVSSVMFMAVMNIRTAIVSESTLSFMGIGLPLEVISLGSMLSLSENAFLSGSFWIILVPGVFLAVTLICITNIGNYLRKNITHRQSNL